MEHLAGVLSTLKDAETGQRGFLLTGAESYLEPYPVAKMELVGELKVRRTLTAASLQQQQRLDALERVAGEKMDELGETITHRRSGVAEGALAIVRTDRGKAAVDRIRILVAELEHEERAVLATRQEEWAAATTCSAALNWGGTALLLFLITSAAFMTSRDYRAREMESWLRVGQMGRAPRCRASSAWTPWAITSSPSWPSTSTPR